MAGNNQYYGTIPTIQQAYQNDPRNKLAQSALALGTSTSPVAQGAWGVPDGMARAAQAILGAVMEKKMDQKYASREQAYTKGMADAAGMASDPNSNPVALNPATVNPAADAAAQAPHPMAAAANALAGGQGPIRTIDPNTALNSDPTAPPSAPMAPPPTPMASAPPQAPTAPPAPVLAPAASVNPMSGVPGALGMTPMDYYRRGIRPIEGGTDPRTGAFRTSPKGAVGPGQIMPGTGPEAAKAAGLPWDEQRFRTDAQYNDALGAAYYAKQLDRFKDPIVAAAAYNAGPGKVSRALRKASATGTDYTAHLLPETQRYVANFADAVGNPTATDAGPSASPVNPTAGVVPPAYENVPSLPSAPPAQAPGAPALPQEVHTNRIPMAQALMRSGNPDLMAIAQTYLDKGLDEQNDARKLSSQQQFQQSQTGYSANLADWQNSRSDDRTAQAQDHRDAINHNYDRESKFADQMYGAGQNAENRTFQRSERIGGQQFQSGERQATEQYDANINNTNHTWQGGQNDLDRQNRLDVAGIRKDASGARSQQRSAFFNTPTGLKMQDANNREINENQKAISQMQRFMDLNSEQTTGGPAMQWGGARVAGVFNSKIAEMHSISNDSTLANLGGKLGVAISDGDRKFIEDANISPSQLPQVNTNIARARIGALQRKNDYLTEFANAQADGTQAQFTRNWSAFARSTPIVQYGKDGNVIATAKPLTYSQWLASRPKYDANGKRVQ